MLPTRLHHVADVVETGHPRIRQRALAGTERLSLDADEQRQRSLRRLQPALEARRLLHEADMAARQQPRHARIGPALGPRPAARVVLAAHHARARTIA